jgi:hypothetical protein
MKASGKLISCYGVEMIGILHISYDNIDYFTTSTKLVRKKLGGTLLTGFKFALS